MTIESFRTSEDISDKKQLSVTLGASIIGGAVGGSLGGLIAGLLPSMINLPATKRYQEKISNSFKYIEKKFCNKVEDLKKISDAQFKLINENLITLSQTIEDEKIDYLQRIILNSVSYSDYCSYDSILMSRIIRDISSEELKFLLKNYSYKNIGIYSWYNELTSSDEDTLRFEKLKQRMIDENCKLILPNSPEELIVGGLVNIGLLVPAELSLGVHRYKFSTIAVKLIVLLKED